MKSNAERLHVIVSGRVQGVSFRFYTQSQAVALGLSGWVANRSDGSVEVVAEGPRPALERLLDWLKHGPPMARVDDVRPQLSPATHEFSQFTIEL